MKELERGSIHYIYFDHIDSYKFCLVLQEGEFFRKRSTVEILLITSDKGDNRHEQYEDDVEIPVGMTKLDRKSWVLCSQPYPVERSLFDDPKSWCAGRLTNAKLDEIDDAVYKGLCMGLRHKLETVYAEVEPVSMTLTASADLTVAKAPPKERE